MKPSDRLILFTAEGFGLGRIRVAPGTFGSLWGIGLGWLISQYTTDWFVWLLIWVLMFVFGVPLCERASRLLNKPDPGSIVWDEIAAFPLVYALVPVNWITLIAGFVLFRIFDIWKPWPVRWFDRIHGGLGIMADDQAAAVYAAASLWLLYRQLT